MRRSALLTAVMIAAAALWVRGARADASVTPGHPASVSFAAPADVAPRHPLASPFTLPVVTLQAEPELAPAAVGGEPRFDEASPEPMAFLIHRSRKPREPKPARTRPPVTLSAERARILLRSLTVPGWGQLTTGHPTAATVFGIVELGVWTSYTAFRIQDQMRRDAYIRTARVQAGIDLNRRDEEFLRIVGAYASSDEYNQLVVARDAANLYYNDPAAFQRYYDEHALKGADTWEWPDEQSFRRYRGLRKDSQRAGLRANAALGVAVVNRLLSAIHAARLGSTSSSQSWEWKAEPADGDPTAFRVGVSRRF